MHLARLAPAAWSPDQMVAGEIEGDPAVARSTARSFDPKMQEFLSGPVIEPVHDPLRNDLPQLRVVRQDLYIHLLVYDLANSLLSSVRESDICIPGRAPEHNTYFFP